MADQAIGIRHSQKTFTDSGIPQGSVSSYVDSIRIHIDRSAIGLVFPISGSDGTNGAVRRSDPYRASWSLQAAPARTESRPTLYLACPSQIARRYQREGLQPA